MYKMKAKRITDAGRDAIARFAVSGEPIVGTLQLRFITNRVGNRMLVQCALVVADGKKIGITLVEFEPVDVSTVNTLTFVDTDQWKMRWTYTPEDGLICGKPFE